ncbi:MAG: Holliday junction branch migration protein RuvA [bacterium]|nr:Holliday junction branch migration protein RuvA [bacterium]
MIVFLEGVLEEKTPSRVVVNVGGVGYEVLISLSTYEDLPAVGERIRLCVYHSVREDDEVLYGFSTKEERAMFMLLIGVTSIGPTTALGILSGLPLVSLRAAIANEDVRRLSSIKGVGKKTAERIIVELKDKMPVAAGAEERAEKAPTEEERVMNDAVLALVALGYRNAEAYGVVKRVMNEAGGPILVEEVVRRSLVALQEG